MAILYKNNANSTLASGINTSVTSITLASGGGANFPAVSGSDFFYATLIKISDGTFEIIKVTARSTDTLTVVRAQEGTSAGTFSAGDRVELRITAGLLDQLKADVLASKSSDANLLDGYNSTQFSGPNSTVKTFFWDDLSAVGTQARTFEIARLGIDYNDWNGGTGPFEVELYEAYYSRGLKKKYVIYWGYTNTYGIQLVEYTGAGDNNFQVRVSAPVLVSGDNYYISVFVDVGYYSQVDVRVTTNRDITSSNPPAIATTYINSSPTPVNISNFSPDSTVNFCQSTAVQVAGNQLLHAGNYSSYALPLSGGSITGNLVLDGATDKTLTLRSSTNWYYYLKGVGDNFRFEDGNNTVIWNVNYNGGTTGKFLQIFGNAWRVNNDGTLYSENKLSFSRNDLQRVFETYNSSASNATQFFIDHSYGVVNIGNARGAINIQGYLALNSSNYSNYALPLSGGSVSGRVTASTGSFRSVYTFTSPGSKGTYVWVRAPMGSFNGGDNTVKFSVQRDINANGSSPYGGPSADFTVHSREWHGGQECCMVYYSEHGSGSGTGGAYISQAGPRDLSGNGYWFYMRLEGGLDYNVFIDASSGPIGTFASTTDPGSVPQILGWGLNVLGTNGNSARVLTSSVGIGGYTDVDLGVSGQSHFIGALHFGGTYGSYGSWGTRQSSSGGTHYINALAVQLDGSGYNQSWYLRANNSGVEMQQRLKIKRSEIAWYQHGNNNAEYLHMKTNLWAGGSPNGQTSPTMSMFHFKGYTYDARTIDSMVGFHNWSGGVYNLQMSNAGSYPAATSPYVSTDGYIVLVLRTGSNYTGITVDYHQLFPYTYIDGVVVTASQGSANASGVY